MRSFTLILSCLLLVAAHVSADEPGMIHTMAKEVFQGCAEEVGIGPEHLQNMLNPLSGPKNEETIQKLSCLLACTLRRTGLMATGKLITENIKAAIDRLPKLPIPIIHQMKIKAEYCIEEAHKEDGDCRVVRKFIDCFRPYMDNKIQYGQPEE